jgi:hypothetical protein
MLLMKNTLAYCLNVKFAHKTSYNIMPQEYNRFAVVGILFYL